MTYEDIGTRIKERRKELNISAITLADRLGLSKATIHRYENGDIRNIKLPVIDAMAQVLKVNPLWLLGKSEVKDGHAGYDVCDALDDLLRDLMTYDDLVCHGKPVTPEVRGRLIMGLQILKGSLTK